MATRRPPRCDRCGGKPTTWWWSPTNGLPIVLCGTHDTRHGPALRHAGWDTTEP